MGGKEAVVETGKYEMFVGDKVSAEKGKFIVVRKEENGKCIVISGIQMHYRRQHLLHKKKGFQMLFQSK
jgi:hypothetical protein